MEEDECSHAERMEGNGSRHAGREMGCKKWVLREGAEELLVNAAKASVRENEDDVAFPRFAAQPLDDRADLRHEVGGRSRRAEALDQRFRVQAPAVGVPLRVEETGQDHPIRSRERAGERILGLAALSRIAPRLEDGDESPPREPTAGGIDDPVHGGGMMREVVHDRDPRDLASHLHSALDALEAR